MAMDMSIIKQILLDEHYITEEDVQKSEEYAQAHNVSFLDYLYKQEILTTSLLGQAMAEKYKTKYFNLNLYPPTRDLIVTLPEETAKKFNTVLVEHEDPTMIFTTDNPEQPELLPALQALYPGKTLTILYSLTEELESIFVHYKPPLQDRFDSIVKGNKSIATSFFEEILADALAFRASDIHFEPLPHDVIIRLRVDGVLQEAGRISKEHYENVVNRIKVQANLRIDEHKACQDGAIRVNNNDGNNFDLRISIVPTLDGEKICIRVLAQYVKGINVHSLGLSERDEKILLTAIKKPFGMILVVGPTGSGKSTTLYALLKILHKPQANITTIEDPVEFKIPGINQIQVNPDTNITFAAGLRSIARQDPDVILVGEIRDKETADIAVNAALTGHLLLSTFHSNDAATAIPRILDMGAEPFLVASSLELIIAQRLVRKICESCRYSYTVSTKELQEAYKNVGPFIQGNSVTLYKGKGCDACNKSGFKGRIAVFEFLQNTPEMQDLILQNPAMKQISALARKQGSLSMFEDGLLKVHSGITTIEELLRVAQPPSMTDLTL